MKIQIFSNYFPPEMGAASNRIYNLAKGLQDQNHDVEVICPLPNYPTGKIFKEYRGRFKKIETKEGIKLRRYWIYPSNSKKTIARFLAMFSFAFSFWFGIFHLWRRKPDVIIVQHSPLFVSFSAIILSKLIPENKLVLNVSDLWPLTAAELGVLEKNSRMYKILEWIEKFNYRKADLIMGQSKEILEHVTSYIDKPVFLYRNISPEYISQKIITQKRLEQPIKIVYAGLLGVAQGVYDICVNIDFSAHGTELHLYGSGNEEEKLKELIKERDDIIFHGSVTKPELHKAYPDFQAALVPLANRIYGAVPSKIYELVSFGIPILFCGGGEGAQIIERNQLGFTSTPAQFIELENNIKKLKSLSEQEYQQIISHCDSFKKKELDFEKQISALHVELTNLI